MARWRVEFTSKHLKRCGCNATGTALPATTYCKTMKLNKSPLVDRFCTLQTAIMQLHSVQKRVNEIEKRLKRLESVAEELREHVIGVRRGRKARL